MTNYRIKKTWGKEHSRWWYHAQVRQKFLGISFWKTLDFFCQQETAWALLQRYKLNEGTSHKTEYIYL